MPKTIRRITSRLMSFIDGCTANGVPDRPPRDRVRGELLDDLAVAAHRLAVEGGHDPLARSQMFCLVEQQHRVLAHDRPEDGVALAGVEGVRTGRRRPRGCPPVG